MLARAVPAVTIGPLAGVLLDRFDRKRIMIASDLARAIVALGFILALTEKRTWLLYLFSALLMVASPFFTAGRSAIWGVLSSVSPCFPLDICFRRSQSPMPSSGAGRIETVEHAVPK